MGRKKTLYWSFLAVFPSRPCGEISAMIKKEGSLRKVEMGRRRVF